MKDTLFPIYYHYESLRTAGPYLAGGQGGQLPPLGKLNVDFFNEVFVFDGIFLVAILVINDRRSIKWPCYAVNSSRNGFHSHSNRDL